MSKQSITEKQSEVDELTIQVYDHFAFLDKSKERRFAELEKDMHAHPEKYPDFEKAKKNFWMSEKERETEKREVYTRIETLKCEIEVARRERVFATDKKTLEDYESAKAKLKRFQLDEEKVVKKVNTALLEYNGAVTKGSEGFARSITAYDAECARLKDIVEELEVSRDALRKQMLPIEREVEGIRKNIEMKMMSVR